MWIRLKNGEAYKTYSTSNIVIIWKADEPYLSYLTEERKVSNVKVSDIAQIEPN